MPDWDNQKARTIFEQMLVQTGNKIDGVAAANDGLANAVVTALKAKKLKPIPLSGQDATAQGVQNIISGWQTNTVYKYAPIEATLRPPQRSRWSRERRRRSNATANERQQELPPTLVIPLVSITKANYNAALQGRTFLKRSEVCRGEYKQYC